MQIQFVRCSKKLLPKAIEIVDYEFIYSKKREISISKRFPLFFTANNVKNIYLALNNDQIVAVTGIKLFTYILKNQVYSGGMLGCVCTREEYRRKGVASRLLDEVNKDFVQKQIDFGMLWATNHDFYYKHGWRLMDNGLFCDLSFLKNLVTDINDHDNIKIIRSKNYKIIEDFRIKHSYSCISRLLDNYNAIPIPAINTEKLLLYYKGKFKGYIIYGSDLKKNIYIYEICSEKSFYSQILNIILQLDCNRIYLNTYSADNFRIYMNNSFDLKCKKQDLTMVKIYSESLNIDHLKEIYISFLDRI